jgi:hypothetical protein
MMSTIPTPGARLGIANADGRVRTGTEGMSREIGKKSANGDDRSGDGGEKKRRLRRMLRRETG